MARIFITGSSDGLGQIVARNLIAKGHQVTLHARSAQRGEEAMAAVPGAEGVLIADLSSISQTKQLAADANASGVFDAVIHNAAVGFRQKQAKTADGVEHLFAVNSLAPYILTSLMHKPKNVVYMSSGMHVGGDASLRDVNWNERSFNPSQAYSDSKLHNIILSFAVARHWPDVASNAVSPGWVQTKMGGPHAPGDLKKAGDLPTRLAISEKKEIGSGKYYVAQGVKELRKEASDERVQDEYLRICESISGVKFPA